MIILGSLSLSVSATQVEVSGSNDELNRAINAYSSGLIASRIDTVALVDSVARFLSYRGYLDAQIELQKDRLLVKPGRQTKLNYLVISSDKIDSLRIDAPLTQDRTTFEAERIISELEPKGYYFARLNIDSVVRAGNEANLFMSVIPGPVVTVAHVQSSGLEKSNPKLVQRLLSPSINEKLTRKTLRQADKRARQISWLNFNPPVKVIPRPGYQSADLEFSFTEKKRFTFFGGFGYLSEEKSGLVWQLAANLRSLFGGGRTFEIDSEKRERGNQTLRLRYAQVSFWPVAGEFGFELSTRDYRDQFSEFAFGAYFDFRLDPETVWGTSLGFKRVEPAGPQSGHSRYSVGLKLARSTTDNDFSPASGYQLLTSLTYAHRRQTDDSLALVPDRLIYNETRVAVALDLFTRLGSRLVLKSSLGYRGLESADEFAPLSELILIGGPGSVRGFKNDRFAARRVGLVTIEPRVRFARGYLFVFYDGAWMSLDRLENNQYRTIGEYRQGYGLGFALRGGSNQVALSFGWQPELDIDQPRLNIELSADL